MLIFGAHEIPKSSAQGVETGFIQGHLGDDDQWETL